MADRRQEFEELLGAFRSNEITRRQFLTRAAALGLSAAAMGALIGVRNVGAQDATPAGGGEAIVSVTREEFQAAIDEAFPKDPEAQPGGLFIIGDSTDITTTNAILGDNSPTNDYNLMVFETLYSSSPVDGSYGPGLADYWEISPDGLVYTFHLNQDATWHDGTPFTSADVQLSFDAQATPETGSAYTGSFTETVASYQAVDDYTFEMTLNAPLAPVVAIGNSYCPIMPAHIWQDVPFAEWAQDPGSNGTDPSRVIGTGPFMFGEWVQGESLTLNKNENYYLGAPNIDQIVFRVYPDVSSAVEALRAGEIDAFENVDPADVESLEGEPDLTVAIYDTLSFSFYGYNLDPEKTPLFQQREVRQALFYALDRQSIVDNIQLGMAEVAHGTQPVLSPAYAPDQINTIYNYDPDKANQLLDEAGWTLGEDGVRVNADGLRLAFEVMYSAGSPATDQMVAYIQDAWRAIGVEMTPNAVDFSTVLVPTITETYDYEIALLGFNWDITGDQRAMFATESYGPGFNFMRYSNPEYDELSEQANVELDEERRRELLIQASNIVNDDLPVGIISFRKDRTAYNETRVHNYHPNALGGLLWSLADRVWVSE